MRHIPLHCPTSPEVRPMPLKSKNCKHYPSYQISVVSSPWPWQICKQGLSSNDTQIMALGSCCSVCITGYVPRHHPPPQMTPWHNLTAECPHLHHQTRSMCASRWHNGPPGGVHPEQSHVSSCNRLPFSTHLPNKYSPGTMYTSEASIQPSPGCH